MTINTLCKQEITTLDQLHGSRALANAYLPEKVVMRLGRDNVLYGASCLELCI